MSRGRPQPVTRAALSWRVLVARVNTTTAWRRRCCVTTERAYRYHLNLPTLPPYMWLNLITLPPLPLHPGFPRDVIARQLRPPMAVRGRPGAGRGAAGVLSRDARQPPLPVIHPQQHLFLLLGVFVVVVFHSRVACPQRVHVEPAVRHQWLLVPERVQLVSVPVMRRPRAAPAPRGALLCAGRVPLRALRERCHTQCLFSSLEMNYIVVVTSAVHYYLNGSVEPTKSCPLCDFFVQILLL